jgi:Rrf2 family iron-sulfur cluster assembly transcriptional regulator
MQELVRAGILKGVRGPKGGYRLARERRRVTVGEIVRVVAALELYKESGHGGTRNWDIRWYTRCGISCRRK